MDYVIPELDIISRQLTSLERPKKAKMLVVDDEPDNLDLLYRTFRRDFQVLKAESGVHALEMLNQEGEVAVIISDQRMPEMKGTEFLSRTVPQFPDTMRIILTGFTDVEDLVEAINSGQVYRYITKPWDPNELKVVVQRAAETYELLKQRTEELHRSQTQIHLLATLVQISQNSRTLEDCLQPIAKAVGQVVDADVCILQKVETNHLAAAQGTYGAAGGAVENWLDQDPLVQEAIVSQRIQAAVNLAGEGQAPAPYSTSGTQAHLLFPIVYHQQVMALLSLQWKQSLSLREDEILILHLAARQIAVCLQGLSTLG